MSEENRHPTAAPIRYSSRYKIFPNKQPAEPNHRSIPQDEIYKLLAKIRSLQDDIRVLVGRNEQLETDNSELLKLEGELETAVAVQESQIVSLTNRIQFEEAATQNILDYQRNLQEVGEKVSLLTEIIANKNQKHGILRFEREKVTQENLKLKQQSNKMHYEQIQMQQKIDQLIQLVDPERITTLEVDLPRKIEMIVEECRTLQEKIAGKETTIQSTKREGVEALMREKEKQIQLQYNLKLLKERARDYQQKRNYFSNCYNEQSIQSVIDDMLVKQHALRKQLDEQMEAIAALRAEGQQAINTARKRVGRERNSLVQELNLQRLENELHAKKKDRAESDFRRLTDQTIPIEEQSTAISQQVLEANNDLYQRIKMLQSENMHLQTGLTNLNEEVGLLRRELSV